MGRHAHLKGVVKTEKQVWRLFIKFENGIMFSYLYRVYNMFCETKNFTGPVAEAD